MRRKVRPYPPNFEAYFFVTRFKPKRISLYMFVMSAGEGSDMRGDVHSDHDPLDLHQLPAPGIPRGGHRGRKVVPTDASAK